MHSDLLSYLDLTSDKGDFGLFSLSIMVLRYSTRKNIFDTLHKCIVSTCILVTAGGFSFLGYKGYNYLMYVKPATDSLRKQKQRELLEEGSSENELLKE